MLTTTYGHESEMDLEVIAALEYIYSKPMLFFHPIRQPTSGEDGYWHTRVKGMTGSVFVRVDTLGTMHIYKPTSGQTFEDTLCE